MKDHIMLTYVSGGVEYRGCIPRESLSSHMEHLRNTFPPGHNFNAEKLCDLIPKIYSIKINEDVTSTQDVPFILYKVFCSDSEQMLRLQRPCTIVWDFFRYYCEEAKKNNK